MKDRQIGKGMGSLAIVAGLAAGAVTVMVTVSCESTSPGPGPVATGEKKLSGHTTKAVPDGRKTIPKEEREKIKQWETPKPLGVPRIKMPEPPVEPPPATKPQGEITQMDIGTLFQLQEDGRAFVVDVRPGFFYGLNHIAGAISMPKKNFEADFAGKKSAFDAAVAAKKPIVLYCANSDCPDARGAAKILAKEGYSSSVFKGGWDEWKDAGFGG